MKVGARNELYVRRGDDHTLKIELFDPATSQVTPFLPGDIVYFTVKENVLADDHVLQKVITSFDDGAAFAVFTPADTKPLGFRSYVYDSELVRNGKVITIIPQDDREPPPPFIVTAEVTDE